MIAIFIPRSIILMTIFNINRSDLFLYCLIPHQASLTTTFFFFFQLDRFINIFILISIIVHILLHRLHFYLLVLSYVWVDTTASWSIDIFVLFFFLRFRVCQKRTCLIISSVLIKNCTRRSATSTSVIRIHYFVLLVLLLIYGMLIRGLSRESTIENIQTIENAVYRLVRFYFLRLLDNLIIVKTKLFIIHRLVLIIWWT